MNVVIRRKMTSANRLRPVGLMWIGVSSSFCLGDGFIVISFRVWHGPTMSVLGTKDYDYRYISVCQTSRNTTCTHTVSGFSRERERERERDIDTFLCARLPKTQHVHILCQGSPERGIHRYIDIKLYIWWYIYNYTCIYMIIYVYEITCIYEVCVCVCIYTHHTHPKSMVYILVNSWWTHVFGQMYNDLYPPYRGVWMP